MTVGLRSKTTGDPTRDLDWQPLSEPPKATAGRQAQLLAERFAAAGGSEEWLALFSVALDETRDVRQACDMADACHVELAHQAGEKRLAGYRTKAEECHWVTMPADGEGGGGTPVCIDGSGNIHKGPAGMAGKKPDELPKKKPPAAKPKTPPAKPAQTTREAGQQKTPDYVGKRVDMTAKPPDSLKKHGLHAVNKLTREQSEAVERYTSEDYALLNSQMRECPPDYECVQGPTRKFMEDVEAAIASAPPLPEPVTVHRGLQSLKPETRQQLLAEFRRLAENGGEFRMPSITSTTARPHVVGTFAFGQKASLVFQIKARTGLYVESLSVNQAEAELLQSAKTRYRVVAVADANFVGKGKGPSAKKTFTTVYLEELE